jgi:hypothetical protein
MNVEEFVRQMKEQHGESLRDMPLPEGVEDYLRDRIKLGDLETVIFMQKLAWVFGVQTGQAAAAQSQDQGVQFNTKRIEA